MELDFSIFLTKYLDGEMALENVDFKKFVVFFVGEFLGELLRLAES